MIEKRVIQIQTEKIIKVIIVVLILLICLILLILGLIILVIYVIMIFRNNKYRKNKSIRNWLRVFISLKPLLNFRSSTQK